MKPIEVKKGADGIYFCRPYLGTNSITGKPIRPYRRFPEAEDESEALAMAQEWVNGLAMAADLHVSQRLDQLLSRYIDHMEAANASPNTVKTYRSCLRCYVEPYLGAADPAGVEPYMIDGLYNMLLLTGAKSGEEGIAPATVIKLHNFLRGAYKWFGLRGICRNNPMLSVGTPEPDVSEAVAFNESEFASIGSALAKGLGERAESPEAIFMRNVCMAAWLALYNGERCGEVCANSRQDAHLAQRYMHIGHNAVESNGSVWRRAKTKGKKSRNVSMDEVTCERISAHYEWQRSYLDPYRRGSMHTTICTDAHGRMMRPSKVSEAFSGLRDRLGLPKDTSFHTLRHTHATWLLMEGANIKDIQERLGHANIATTLGIYSHMLPGRDQMAAKMFGDAAARIRDASRPN